MRELNHKGIVTYERIIDKDDSVTLISRDDGRVTFMEQTAASGEILNRTIYNMEERKNVNDETAITYKDEKGSVTGIIEKIISAEGELITTTKDAEGNVIITNRRPYKKNK